MATTAENIRTWLAGSSLVTAYVGGSSTSAHARIFVNHVPDETQNKPFIWLQRISREREQLLNGSHMTIFSEEFALECVAIATTDARSLADKVVQRFEAATPGTTMGSNVAKAVIIEDQDDDYLPKNAQDSGSHISALRVTVWRST